MDPLKMYLLLKMEIFHCYVSLPESTWIFVADERTKEVKGGCRTLQPNQSNSSHFSILPFLQLSLTKKSFPPHAFFNYWTGEISRLEVKITQLNKKHLIDRFHREAGEHPFQSPISQRFTAMSSFEALNISSLAAFINLWSIVTI